MYDEGKTGLYLTKSSDGRKRLLDYVTAVRSGKEQLDQSTLDRLIAEEREYWPWRHQKPDLAHEESMLRALLG